LQEIVVANAPRYSWQVFHGIVEPLRITRQVLAGATEAALSVLRIDDVLWAKQDPSIPEMPGEED